MQEVLTDWLWKIDIKDPRFIKGYSKLTPVAKKIPDSNPSLSEIFLGVGPCTAEKATPPFSRIVPS